MQSPGAPVRPGLGRGTRKPVLGVGWAASDPQPGSFMLWPGGVGPALFLFWPACLATDLFALVQVCGGVPQDATLNKPKATLPEA